MRSSRNEALILKYDLLTHDFTDSMNALLLVDIQNDFLPGGALAVPDGDAIIPLANKLQTKFPLVVATQDWHPPNHGSFAANHPGRTPFEQIDLHGLAQILWPVPTLTATAAFLTTDTGAPPVWRSGSKQGVSPTFTCADWPQTTASGSALWMRCPSALKHIWSRMLAGE
jgi:nicotinamidase-related amidase